MNERMYSTGALAPVSGVRTQLRAVETTRQSLIKEIERANAAHDLIALVGEKVRLARSGDKWRGFCPFHGDQRVSTFVIDAKTNQYSCSVCEASGDALSWLMYDRDISFYQAVAVSLKGSFAVPQAMKEQVGAAIQHAILPPSDDAARRHKREVAQKIWNESLIAPRSLVERYLFTKGLFFDGPLPENLRFHPNLYHEPRRSYFPAMVAKAEDLQGKFAGIHRTYLTPDGLNIAKPSTGGARRMLGDCFGSYVHLREGNPNKVVIAECIESALTIAQACPEYTVYSSMALGNLKAPVPEGAEEVILCADGNNNSPHMAERILMEAARKHSSRGHRVLLARAPLGMDFNDMFLAG